jgi:ABC-type branched-subunit amino acid transport system substrate-binding protein
MITQFKDYTDNQPSQKQEEIDHVIQEYLGTYERKMMIFENYWNDSFFNETNNQSVKPFLENIGNLIGESVSTSHRMIHSKADLSQ